MSVYKFPYVDKCANLGYSPIVVYAFGEEFMSGILGPELARGVCSDCDRLMTKPHYTIMVSQLHRYIKKEIDKVRSLIGDQTLTQELFEHINRMYDKENKDA